MKNRVYPLILMLLAIVAGIFVTGYVVSARSPHVNSEETKNRTTSQNPSPNLVKLPQQLNIETTATYPHDTKSFTQGLEFHDGNLYEGTGNYGNSKLRRVELKTGKVLQEISLPQQYFGEGITIFGDKIYQLTWQENICFVYDKKTFQQLHSFPYRGEGWGMTNDGTHLIVSNGTSTLQFFDPKTFQVVKTLDVREGDRKITQLNELEYIHGEIWANVWETNFIVRINPASGQVIGWIDCSGFVPKGIAKNDRERVLNGIAFDPATNRIFITGKFWPVMYEWQLHEESEK